MQDTLKHIRKSLAGYIDQSEINSMSRYIIEDVTGLSLSAILTDKSKQITAEQRRSIDKIISRLQNFEPIQYILGYCEFYGLSFDVKTGVLIPRSETEELVDLIIKDHKNATPSILDIGTGSGCIAISLSKNIPNSKVEAWDISEEALKIAKENASKNKVSTEFRLINVLGDVPIDMKFDIIVSNPPYVLDSEKAEMEKHVLDHEPHLALFVPDNEALMFYERIADVAKTLLTSDGHLYFEINSMKGQETLDVLEKKGFTDILLIQDIYGKDRIIKAKRPN